MAEQVPLLPGNLPCTVKEELLPDVVIRAVPTYQMLFSNLTSGEGFGVRCSSPAAALK